MREESTRTAGEEGFEIVIAEGSPRGGGKRGGGRPTLLTKATDSYLPHKLHVISTGIKTGWAVVVQIEPHTPPATVVNTDVQNF